MHRHVTRNRCYATYNEFCRSVLPFPREKLGDPLRFGHRQFPRHQSFRFWRAGAPRLVDRGDSAAITLPRRTPEVAPVKTLPKRIHVQAGLH
jgi:hypothetical protein